MGGVGCLVVSISHAQRGELPRFQPDRIPLGSRCGRVLMIVVDNCNEDGGGWSLPSSTRSTPLVGHSERRTSYGYDAGMAAIRAKFNGDMSCVTIPYRWVFGSCMMMPRSWMGGMNPALGRPSKIQMRRRKMRGIE